MLLLCNFSFTHCLHHVKMVWLFFNKLSCCLRTERHVSEFLRISYHISSFTVLQHSCPRFGTYYEEYKKFRTMVKETLCWSGPFWCFADFQRDKWIFPLPIPSHPSNVVPLLAKHVRNDKYPNFEWTGEEGGMLIVLFSEISHLKTLSQQFCHWL